MKTLGIVAHSAEGGALCFITACREGARTLGDHMHPTIALSCVPMALSMPGWRASNYDEVAEHLAAGIRQVARAGADFFICPDNTAHIVLEQIADDAPIPGLHIAEVVCEEIARRGWRSAGLLGTDWTMTGPVYASALERRGVRRLVPDDAARDLIDRAIFDELCNGVFDDATTRRFVEAIDDLKARGAECVILGCTEIPLIITADNSPLPILDSTRLLAAAGVREALSHRPIKTGGGWLAVVG